MSTTSRHLNNLLVGCVLCLLLLLSACSDTGDDAVPQAATTTQLPTPVIGTAAVNAERLLNADQEPGVWMSHGRDYSEQRFSPLDQINRGNVASLGLAWFADLDTRRGQEATPIMVDGVIYISTAWSKVKAYDAVNGSVLWEYDPQVPGEWAVNACCDVINRGVAVWEGKVFVGTIDGRLIALDSATGAVIWDVYTIDRDKPYSITGAPRVVKGKVLIGNGGAEFGVRGYVSAYDVDSGALAWRFYTVPGNPAEGFEDPILEMAAETWRGEWWHIGGGGTVWDAIVYDPQTDLLYVGTGNGSPWNHTLRSQGEGDNLFLVSIVALNPDDGSYVWHYQVTPGETWDHTATQPIMVADLVLDGMTRRVLMQAPKNGFFYILDAATGELLSAEKFAPVTWAERIDMETGRPVENPEARYDRTGEPWTSPYGPNGAHTWHSMSYNPGTGLVYIPVQHAGFTYIHPEEYSPRPIGTNLGLNMADGAMPQDPGIKAEILSTISGELLAWDPVNQRPAWSVERAGPSNGGTLTTAGGLVFQGTGTGEFQALDAASGELLWSSQVQTGVIAAPISYEIDGIQYVAQVVGTGGSWSLPAGEAGSVGNDLPNISRLLVYRLGGEVALPPAPPRQALVLDPPSQDSVPGDIESGRVLYANFCGACHGDAAVSGGLLPDLRYTPVLSSAELWRQIVLEGLLSANGMVSFAAVVDQDGAEDLRAFLVFRAHETLQYQQQ